MATPSLTNVRCVTPILAPLPTPGMARTAYVLLRILPVAIHQQLILSRAGRTVADREERLQVARTTRGNANLLSVDCHGDVIVKPNALPAARAAALPERGVPLSVARIADPAFPFLIRMKSRELDGLVTAFTTPPDVESKVPHAGSTVQRRVPAQGRRANEMPLPSRRATVRTPTRKQAPRAALTDLLSGFVRVFRHPKM
ncbi:MAG: hypothetical protein IT290_03265 [Deltaproteobacteria bacterium]|nr:hypothetical protein [Deltaproteobacteria bacterium]